MNDHLSDNTSQAALRQLPSVDHLLRQTVVANLLEDHPRPEVLLAIRRVLDQRRSEILAGESADTGTPALALEVRRILHERARPSLRRVINATGIVLHTGLGRAPLAESAIEAIADVAAGYCNLELDLASGQRGQRLDHVRALLRELTGAEDGLIVNNNAAATYLALNTLAAGHEAIVSRGQLVEIGGSYRMPDIMAAAGCRMVEVGTTNRTRVGDYESALTEQTSVLLRVHTSNYRIQGFVTSVKLDELVGLARKYRPREISVVDDLGSGLLEHDVPWPGAPADSENEAGVTPPPGEWDEPSVRDSVAAGADLTLFSGDKLLGGPQAGVIVGRADLLQRLRKNPLMRTFRPDKMTLAGMEATLRLHRDPETLAERLPAYRMLATPPEHLRRRAKHLARALEVALSGVSVVAQPEESYAGGGSLPTLPFPTWVVRVRFEGVECQAVVAALRQRDLPIICRVHEDAVVFDCRTLTSDDVDQIPPAVAEAVRELLEGV
ncbi:MAG: L-seryl-tRNA(Sec) selenium transferase [Phycisphaerae bacterium]|nr:L-seryl-tRNA(Sec) selenium transferase [Phycisphaerae bacterium]